MSLVKKIKTLCKEHGTCISKLEKEFGFGNGSIRKWNTSLPSVDKVQKVADYFGISIDSLIREEDAKCQP